MKFNSPDTWVEILLATHNSDRFLAELLDSLIEQTWQGFTLLVADDGSTDGTLGILERYGRARPGWLRLVGRTEKARGPRATFSSLLDAAAADYVMLCDHDDIWLPHKVEASLGRMAALEAELGAQLPILLHTDLEVVGAALEPLSPSFFRYTGMDPQAHDLDDLLMSNVATGCATIVNRALYERARPVPPEAIMHDWWLALVASCLGRCSFLNDATVLYRQHGGNVVGARRENRSLLPRISRALLSRDADRALLEKSRQAAALLARHGAEMDPRQFRAVETLATIWSQSRWGRWRAFRKSGLAPRGLLRNAALFLTLSRGSDEPPPAPA